MFLKLLFAFFLVCTVNQATAKKTTIIKKTEEKKPQILAPYGIEVDSTHALLIDYQTGQVLMEKNADESLEPASMTKIMTAYMVMKAFHEGRINPESMVTISSNARKMEGSDMFLEIGDQVKIDDLLKGLIVVSGNDAAIALAEFLAGTQDSFAVQMTKLAQEIGCTKTEFKNASGLPQEGHISTARDLITISKRTFEDFPNWYSLYSQTSFTYRGITQQNRNGLLLKNIGCDGVKTGHAKQPGFGMVASAVKNGRRLFLVVAGLNSKKQRETEAERLLKWGFNTFANYKIAPQDIIQLPVRYGKKENITIKPAKHLLTIHRNRLDQLKATIRYQDVLEAPIKPGDQVGEIIITHPDLKEPMVVPLIVNEDALRSAFFIRIWQSLKYLFLK